MRQYWSITVLSGEPRVLLLRRASAGCAYVICPWESHRRPSAHSHRDRRCYPSLSSPTTRSCILPINSALWASVACIAAEVSFAVVVVEPNKTTPPIIAATAVMTADGTNAITPAIVAKIHINPPTMTILEICEIRCDLAIASARSSMRSSRRRISLRKSLSATHSPLLPSSIVHRSKIDQEC
jgi:hypothetical protein